MLTWPLPMTQPILAGVAAFVLLGIAVQTNGWRHVTAQQGRLLLGFAIAAILGAGPMVLFCLLTVVIFLLVISFGLMILLVLLLLLIGGDDTEIREPSWREHQGSNRPGSGASLPR